MNNEKLLTLKAVTAITATNVGRRVYVQYREDVRNGKRIDSTYRSRTSAWMYCRVLEDSAVCAAFQAAKHEEGLAEFWEEIASSLLQWAYEAPSKYYLMLTAKD